VNLLVLAAAMCLPPPPGTVEPPPPAEAEKARVIATTSRNIVSGVVTRNDAKGVRFKIQRVYKGTLKRGQVIEAYPAHGFYSGMPCPGMIPPPQTFKGARGVIAFNEVPAPLRWVESRWLAEMTRTGLIGAPR
jgi:hypothetical protein